MINISDIKKNMNLLEKDPLNPNANHLIASYLAKTGRLDEVYPFLSKVIESGKEIKGIYLLLGQYLLSKKKIVEAQEAFEKELEIFPNSLKAKKNLAYVMTRMGEISKAVKLYKEYVSKETNSVEVWDNLIRYAHYDPESSNEELLKYAQEYSQNLYPSVNNLSEVFDLSSFDPFKPRLKIGLVSGDFKNHPLMYFIKDLLLELNRFADVYCYCNNKYDNQTTLLRMEVSRWRDVDKLSDAELTEKIRNDKIDILLDLSGNTTSNRLRVFAMRAAPVQVSWLGQAGSLGIKNMDYILSNSEIVLNNEDQYYLEKPFKLDGIYAPFSPPQEDIKIEEAPCIKNNYVTFGCFNNFIKINSQTMKTWIEILKRVPNSKLYLRNEMLEDSKFKEKLKNNFYQAGIDSNRLILEEYVHNRKSYMNEYNKVDIILDTYPACGVITTNDALWMGAPVITLFGTRMSQRISASILKNIGLCELISSNLDEYINKAVKLSQDFNLIDRYKREIRDKYLKAEICNKEKFAKNLLRAFSVMWYETITKVSK
jgi:protein O-GlcNAc transferase